MSSDETVYQVKVLACRHCIDKNLDLVDLEGKLPTQGLLCRSGSTPTKRIRPTDNLLSLRDGVHELLHSTLQR